MTDPVVPQSHTQGECAKKEVEQHFGVTLDSCPYMLAEDMLVWRELLGAFPDMSARNDGQGLIVTFPGQKSSFYVETGEEIFILREVLYCKEYNYGLRERHARPYVFVDIGANIGIVSILALKNDPAICKVYAFEPVPYTYHLALKNIELNNIPAEKIEIKNIGLGKNAGHQDIQFNILRKGCATTTAQFSNTFKDKNETLTIEIASAAVELSKITFRHPDTPLILKIDCEGGEYDIFQSLQDTEILESVSIIMMEWHYDYERIDFVRKNLQAHGFTVFTLADMNGRTGRLYASK